MASSTTIIEHIVLLSPKEGTNAFQISTMINSLKSLGSLDIIHYLSTGPVHRPRPTGPIFTHMFHSRFRSKDDLAVYMVDPVHLDVAMSTILPICDGLIAVDWVGPKLENGSNPKPGSAMRVQLVKMKEGLGEREKGEVLEVIGGLKEKVSNLKEISFGENFSPDLANGYSIGLIAVFDGMSELDAAAEIMEIGENLKVRDYIDSLLVVDYFVPSQSDDQN